MRLVKVFSDEDIRQIEGKINAWVSSEQVLIINASISEDDDGFRALVVYEPKA